MTGGDDLISDARVPLTPLVARVIELRRGPPALVRWVTARLGWGLCPRDLATRLAREFVRSGLPAVDTTPAADPRATRGASADRPRDPEG